MENINSMTKVPEGSVFINNSIYYPINPLSSPDRSHTHTYINTLSGVVYYVRRAQRVNISNDTLIPSNTIIYKGKIYTKLEIFDDNQNKETSLSLRDNKEERKEDINKDEINTEQKQKKNRKNKDNKEKQKKQYNTEEINFIKNNKFIYNIENDKVMKYCKIYKIYPFRNHNYLS